MQQFISILPALFVLFGPLTGQAPDWVQDRGKSARFPATTYFTGYGIASVDQQHSRLKSEQLALDAAKGTLIEKIQVHIQSEVVSRIEESGRHSVDYAGMTTISSSSLEVTGLESETYYDKWRKVWYALVWAKKEHLMQTYRNQASQIAEQIEGRFESGKDHEAAGHRSIALAEYLLCYPLFDRLQETYGILSTLGTLTIDGILGGNTDVPKCSVSRSQLRQAVEGLINRPIRRPEDLAWSLAYQLGRQLESPGSPVMTTPFTYQDTRMSSPFARFFKMLLDAKLNEVAEWGVMAQASEPGKSGKAEYVLVGTYWQQPEEVKFMSQLRRISDGAVIASAEARVQIPVLEATRLDLTPQNFSTAFSDQKHFRKDEVIEGGLRVETWTDRGAENLVYTEGETMRVYMRVNLPCYVRFIYHLADGSRTLLLDSHYIDETKVNRVYQVPEEFECAAPFGAEVMQVFARTEPFEPMETVERDGYCFLKEDLPMFLAQTRGFKRKQPETMQAEKRVVITTMGR